MLSFLKVNKQAKKISSFNPHKKLGHLSRSFYESFLWDWNKWFYVIFVCVMYFNVQYYSIFLHHCGFY